MTSWRQINDKQGTKMCTSDIMETKIRLRRRHFNEYSFHHGDNQTIDKTHSMSTRDQMEINIRLIGHFQSVPVISWSQIDY